MKERELKSVGLRHFVCDDNLEKYTDSMLFDSVDTGETEGDSVIASATFRYNGQNLNIFLEVAGEVSVNFNGETYKRPSDFPDKLKELIKKRPNNWEYAEIGEKDYPEIGIGMNNWFQYAITNKNFTLDSVIYEKDVSKATPEEILRDMTEIAAEYFKISEAKEDKKIRFVGMELSFPEEEEDFDIFGVMELDEYMTKKGYEVYFTSSSFFDQIPIMILPEKESRSIEKILDKLNIEYYYIDERNEEKEAEPDKWKELRTCSTVGELMEVLTQLPAEMEITAAGGDCHVLTNNKTVVFDEKDYSEEWNEEV